MADPTITERMPDDELDSLAYSRRDALADAAARAESDESDSGRPMSADSTITDAPTGLPPEVAARLITPLPGVDDLMARANAVRHNEDLIDLYRQRESDAPAEHIVRHRDYWHEYAFIAPNACRWCDQPREDHPQLWSRLVGWHQWTEPTDRMRLSRMRGRRTRRQQIAQARETARVREESRRG